MLYIIFNLIYQTKSLKFYFNLSNVIKFLWWRFLWVPTIKISHIFFVDFSQRYNCIRDLRDVLLIHYWVKASIKRRRWHSSLLIRCTYIHTYLLSIYVGPRRCAEWYCDCHVPFSLHPNMFSCERKTRVWPGLGTWACPQWRSTDSSALRGRVNACRSDRWWHLCNSDMKLDATWIL